MMITCAARDLYQFSIFYCGEGVTEQVPASCKPGRKDSLLPGRLGMIRFFSKQRIQERFAGRLVTAAMGLNRNKDSINLSELFRIIQAKNPAAIRFAVHV